MLFMLVGIISAVVAHNKGLKTFRWLFSFGLIGLMTVAFLDNPNEEGITPEESASRAQSGNKVGAWMCGICIVVAIIIFIVKLIPLLK